jgi:hypothetical protein
MPATSDRGFSFRVSASRPLLAVVFDVDLSFANRIGNGLATSVRLFSQADLFHHSSFFAYYGFFRPLGRFDGTILEHSIIGSHRAIDGPSLDLDFLPSKINLLLHGCFNYVAAYPHTAMRRFPFADPKLLLNNRNNFIRSSRSGTG